MPDALPKLPNNLIERVSKHQILPFVGAGVSVGVKWGLFPSWGKLLDDLAQAVEDEAFDAEPIRAQIAKGEYLIAAQLAYEALGSLQFSRFMRERFHIPKAPPDVTLDTVHGIWNLRPSLILTTNYDPVLSWGHETANIVTNGEHAELGLSGLDRSPDNPWIWHLHGRADAGATLILGLSQYEALYKDDPRFLNARRRLQGKLLDLPLLFIGFSLTDQFVMAQLAEVVEITRGCSARSYALMKKQDGKEESWDDFVKRMKSLNVQVLGFDDYDDLPRILNQIAGRAFPGPP